MAPVSSTLASFDISEHDPLECGVTVFMDRFNSCLSQTCSHCSARREHLMKCKGCQIVAGHEGTTCTARYCCADCQRAHWPEHKATCGSNTDMYAQTIAQEQCATQRAERKARRDMVRRARSRITEARDRTGLPILRRSRRMSFTEEAMTEIEEENIVRYMRDTDRYANHDRRGAAARDGPSPETIMRDMGQHHNHDEPEPEIDPRTLHRTLTRVPLSFASNGEPAGVRLEIPAGADMDDAFELMNMLATQPSGWSHSFKQHYKSLLSRTNARLVRRN